jgi:serine protease AprX
VKLEFQQLSRWIFGSDQLQRFTQDSPVMPDVWLAYGEERKRPLDLLLEPHRTSSPAELAAAVLDADSTPDDRADMRLAYNQSHVAVHLSLHEMVRGVVPLSEWWQEHLWPEGTTAVADVLDKRRQDLLDGLNAPMREQGRRPVKDELPGALIWFVGLVGRLEWERTRDPENELDDDEPPAGLTYELLIDAARELLDGLVRVPAPPGRPVLWAINRNRPARPSLWRSRVTVKADAATRLFRLSCRDLCWAVVDSGIDARHPAFLERGAKPKASRVRETYDFTRLRGLLAGTDPADSLESEGQKAVEEIEERLRTGRSVDWELLAPQLRIPHGDGYRPPSHEHGTHVGGILGADWRSADTKPVLDHDVLGVCPDIDLFDLRVFDETGSGDEFAILAALQFVRWRNGNSTRPVIHGVNLSLSLDHVVGSYACGSTPVCEECERLLGAGTVVVAAAGNEGRAWYSLATGPSEGYRQISITDPGNAAGVITVGATHRHQPHTYGVSYFSSRGPTGDGRVKPDLVAPGEKITAPVPDGGLKSLDGTSMAAPHVSGAAALLMARHPELIGSPAEVKRVLCSTATDLGRERYFQGSGMVDALRAIQAV